jgi:hypothetical protein
MLTIEVYGKSLPQQTDLPLHIDINRYNVLAVCKCLYHINCNSHPIIIVDGKESIQNGNSNSKNYERNKVG